MLIFLLEAAFRSLLMAAAVWAGIRMMRVEAVLAQKVAWVLVLLAAGTMPVVMRAPFLALDRALQIPVKNLRSDLPVSQKIMNQKLLDWLGAKRPENTAGALVAADTIPATSIRHETVARIPKPSAAHVLSHPSEPQDSLEAATQDLTSDSRLKLPSDSPVVLRDPAPNPIPSPITQPQRSASRPAAKPAFWTSSRIRSFAVTGYLLVGSLFLLRMIAGLAIAFRIWQRAIPVADLHPHVVAFLGTKALRVRVSPALSTPVTIGSSVILPADYNDWDEAKLRVVLAHEQSHVRQGDFYLQLVAALHVAVFWFSPLGWWLQRKLSELGEALSDRAGLEQASTPASYAQILLEFAARPRRNFFAGAFAGPLTGVAMARTSNLSSRIERVLNDRRFRLAFLGGRRHAFIAAILVPAALVAAVGLIRIAPAVEAAHAAEAAPVIGPAIGIVAGRVTGQITGVVAPAAPDQVTVANFAQTTPPPAPTVAPVAPEAPAPDVKAPQPPEPLDAQEVDEHTASGGKHSFHYRNHSGDSDDDNFAIVHENGDGTLRWNGEYNDELAKVRNKMNLHGDYIWFERDGKSYVITDPAILAQANQMFKGDPQLERQMKQLEQQQGEWEKKMALLEPEMEKAKLPGPEFAEKMAKLNAQLAELQSDKFKKMTDQMNKEFSQEKLAELQEKMGEIQERLGEIQGEIGERQGLIGEKQGEIGEEMGKLGEQMGKIGELEGKHAEEAARKFKSVLDQAFKDGKAKPVE
jgi:beta-lactamase regulating signal transducer with metallopeptidase domain